MVSDQEYGSCMLKCKGCGEVMSPNNPLQTCKQHGSSCKRPREEVVTHLDDGEAGFATLSSARRSHTPHMPSAGRRMLSARTCSARQFCQLGLQPFRQPNWLVTTDAFSAAAIV
eukprot:1160277-Pelagomonas_calceolata.AAC.25